jgi:peroxiredoxin
MVELGELEKQFQEFARRQTRVVVVSLENRESAQQTQQDFPHLEVLADPDRRLGGALEVIHPGAAPGGEDTFAPTTFLLDGTGKVRWLFRPERHVRRLSVAELLSAVDQYLGPNQAGAG